MSTPTDGSPSDRPGQYHATRPQPGTHDDPNRRAPRFGWGISGHTDVTRATKQAIDQVGKTLRETGTGWVSSEAVDLALVFVTPAHSAQLGRIGEMLRTELRARTIMGVTAETIAGGATEIERVAGISILAGALPGVRVSAFTTEDMYAVGDPTSVGLEQLGQSLDLGPETRGTILFTDPFSVPVSGLLGAISRCRNEMNVHTPIVGGHASAGGKPMSNAFLLDGKVRRDGLVGVTLSGAVRCDALVSQGCRPIGEPVVVTSAQRTIVKSLGGRPAFRVMEDAVASLTDADRQHLSHGLFLGRVINEYKDRFGRGDYVIRAVLGSDEASGALALDDGFRPGQTVQFHLFDPRIAHEDLALVLDAQKLHGRPAGAVMVSGLSRARKGSRLGERDATAISRAFARPTAGEQAAKLGSPAHDDHRQLPLAGFGAAGEIGPIGNAIHVLGHTNCAMLFRDPLVTD